MTNTREFPKQEQATPVALTGIDVKYIAQEAERREKARQILRRFDSAKNTRSPYLSIWQEVATYVLPYRGGFYDVTPNGRAVSIFDRNAEIYDDTAINALIKAASAFASYTVNAATQWFNFDLSLLPSTKAANKDRTLEKLRRDTDTKIWLEEVSRITCSLINAKISSNYHSFSQELLAYALSGFLIMEDYSDEIFNIQSIAAKDLIVLNNIYGGIGEVYRTVMLTNEQAVNLFGPSVGKEIMDDVKENPLKERVFIHAAIPRAHYDTSKKDVLNMPIASYWMDYQTSRLVMESGYEEFPFAIGRLNVPPGYTYGFSPAMNVRHTIKSLNKLQKQKLSAGDLALSPAMNVPLDTYVNPLSLKPAALNYHESDAQFRAEPMHTVGNFQINTETIRDTRDQIKQGLMIDLIEQRDRDNTYQAMQEQLLQLKLMSPWQGNLERDALKPLVTRVFNILRRRGGVLPEPPEMLQKAFKEGFGLQITYQSPLAKAQRHFDVSATERTLAFCGQFAELGGMDLVDIRKAVRMYSELLGTPPGILYSDKEMKKKDAEAARQAEMQAQMQQQLMMAQTMQSGAGAAKDMAQAEQAQAQAQATMPGQDIMGGMA